MLKFDALALAKRSCAHTSVRSTRSSGLRTTQAHTRSRLSLLFMRFLHFNIENRLIYQDRFTSNQNCLYLSDIIFSNCLQERLLAGGTITWMTRPSRNSFKGRTRSCVCRGIPPLHLAEPVSLSATEAFLEYTLEKVGRVIVL